MADIIEQIRTAFQETTDKIALLEQIRAELHRQTSPFGAEPIDFVRWVPIEKVQANDYNPNSVAANEMRLLYWSIFHDHYTQPVVTVYDRATDTYVIVDGFHRYTTMKLNQDIRDRTNGFLPVVVIDKPINDRMASTVRHNRARGKHSVAGMASMVFQMLDNGWKDEDICKEIGLSVDELVRLKHITGFSKLFENVEYRKAWESREQILARSKWQREHEGKDH